MKRNKVVFDRNQEESKNEKFKVIFQQTTSLLIYVTERAS
jgi:hypothetical protein